MKEKYLNYCTICGNNLNADEPKNSNYNINGNKTAFCCCCEDDLLKVLLISRGHKKLYKELRRVEA
jgi:hypothetical protein